MIFGTKNVTDSFQSCLIRPYSFPKSHPSGLRGACRRAACQIHQSPLDLLPLSASVSLYYCACSVCFNSVFLSYSFCVILCTYLATKLLKSEWHWHHETPYPLPPCVGGLRFLAAVARSSFASHAVSLEVRIFARILARIPCTVALVALHTASIDLW